MSENYYNLLSKSAVNEPMSYKKSPSKYNIYDSSNLNNQTEKSTPSWKEWKPTSDYQNVNKKLP